MAWLPRIDIGSPPALVPSRLMRGSTANSSTGCGHDIDAALSVPLRNASLDVE
jgi:hypothetical protein